MSYMSLFEKNVRYSNAIFILNDYRYYLKEPNFQIKEEYKEIILESLSLKDKDKFNSLIIYNFSASKELVKSSVIELSEAIFQYLEIFEVGNKKEEYINLIKDSLKSKEKLIDEDKNKLLELVIHGINFIINQSKNCKESFGFEKLGL